MRFGKRTSRALGRSLVVTALLGAWLLAPGAAQAADTPKADEGAKPAAPATPAAPAAATETAPKADPSATPAPAGEAGVGADATVKKEVKAPAKKKVPWRGSQFVWSNGFSAISLDRSSELTYNPTYYMSFGFKPRWWFNDVWNLKANLEVYRELTQADDTTYKNEAWLGDLSLIAGATKFYVIPKAKIELSADLALTFPTSKASLASTMVMAIGPGVRISRSFKVLKGMAFGTNVRVTPYIHRYTTGELANPLISNCAPSAGNCDAFLNSGGRNASLRTNVSLDFQLGILKWLSVGLSYGWFIDRLYAASGGDGAVTWEPQQPQNHRYLSFFGASVSFEPHPALEIALNYQTYAPQLAPDSTYYNPIFNRYTTLSLDLTLRVDGFIALFGGK